MPRFLLKHSLLALLVFSLLAAAPAEAARRKKAAPQPDRFAEIVIEASSGYVLSERNADKRLYPASLTKMMTMYLTFEALQNGEINKYNYIPVSKHAAAQEPSSLGLSPGESIKLEHAMLAVVTKSANDCAVALAEAMAGSESAFARRMTAKARELGMNNTNFANASGLHNRNNYSTARDMAILGQALIRDFPQYYRYFSTSSFTYDGNTFLNHNRLMNSYPGMDGLKTGYVYASGYNLAASAVRGGTRLIGVVFGGRTTKSRNDAMARLLDQSFVRVANIRVAGLQGAAGKTQPAPAETSEDAPQFNAMGLVTEQGDAALSAEEKKPATAKFSLKEYNKKYPTTASKDKGTWAIQVGSFASRDAGLVALQNARSTLKFHLNGGTDDLSPLMTNRGLIYRARVSGLDKVEASSACRILKGACLVLANE